MLAPFFTPRVKTNSNGRDVFEMCLLLCVYSYITVMFQLHFTNDQFEPKVLEAHGLKKLKPNAIPTLFSHRPPPKERKPPSKRLEIRKKCSKKRKALFSDVPLLNIAF